MPTLSKPLTSGAVVTVKLPRNDDLKSQRQLAAKQASTLSRARLSRRGAAVLVTVRD
jgi:hypothetical protein